LTIKHLHALHVRTERPCK